MIIAIFELQYLPAVCTIIIKKQFKEMRIQGMILKPEKSRVSKERMQFFSGQMSNIKV
jgi:hypothetical protein